MAKHFTASNKQLMVYLKSFGVRDVATKRPMTPDTLFALHSMTKMVERTGNTTPTS